MSNASSTYYSPEVTDALYKYIVYRIRRILYLPQSIWEYQCPPLALEIAQLSSYSFSIWSTFHLGFEQRKRQRRILKRTSFKVVIPEHVLKDLDAKNESRLVRCPGTFKVHLSLMQWKPDNMFFFAFCVDDRAKVIASCLPKICQTQWRGDETIFGRKQFGQSCSTMRRQELFLWALEGKTNFVFHACWAVERRNIHMLYVEMICWYIV